MKKSFLFLLMIVSVTIVAQAQMVGTNAKKDRVVFDNDNRTVQNTLVHNVISGGLGYGISYGYHVFDLKYYYLNNWGFQVGGQQINYVDVEDYVLFLLGANKRIMNDGYLCLNVGFGEYEGYYYKSAAQSLGLDFVYVTQKGFSLSAGIEMIGEEKDLIDDICLTVGVGFDFNRLFRSK